MEQIIIITCSYAVLFFTDRTSGVNRFRVCAVCHQYLQAVPSLYCEWLKSLKRTDHMKRCRASATVRSVGRGCFCSSCVCVCVRSSRIFHGTELLLVSVRPYCSSYQATPCPGRFHSPSTVSCTLLNFTEWERTWNTKKFWQKVFCTSVESGRWDLHMTEGFQIENYLNRF
jgi:hypothetical protein